MNIYAYDSALLANRVSSLEEQLNDYSAVIKKIKTLKDSIEASNEWVQESLKTPFISKCNDYIMFYSMILTKLEAHVNYLKNKNKAMESLEDAYSKRS